MSISASQPPTTIDWSLGRYEYIAAQLLPAARAVVDLAALLEGECVVDVGCGTGNATLLAAARGAKVTGIDPAARLLKVARGQAAAQGLVATFALGDSASLPVEDAGADVVLSVFGVTFASDAAQAAAEVARITTPAKRVLISAWMPVGAISEAARVAQDAVRQALGTPPGPPPFAWHERDALAQLLAPYGFEVAVEEQ